jgi:hypothetical protein
MSKKYKKCIYMHTKKYRASPLTAKKKSNSLRRRKKIIGQTENLPPPPHQKSNGPSLSKKNMWGKS